MNRRSLAATVFASTPGRVIMRGGTPGTGGSEKQLYLLGRLLGHSGVRVKLLTPSPDLHGIQAVENVTQVRAWSGRLPLPLKVLEFFWKILVSPSPIYFRGLSLANLAVALIGRGVGKRIVVGLSSDLSSIRQPGRGANLLAFVILKASSQVIAQTQMQCDLLRKTFRVKAAVFCNVVGAEEYGPARKIGFRGRSIDVLWVGSIEPRKGLEKLVSVADLLPNVKFAVVGGQHPGKADYHDVMMNELAGRSNVDVEGFADPNVLPELMGRSKVLLHTSVTLREGLTKEGFPNVFLEAWLSDVRVVSLCVDPDGLLSSDGLGYKVNSVREAADIAERLAKDETEWRNNQEAAFEFARSRDAGSSEVRREFLSLLFGGSTAGEMTLESGRSE